MGNPEHVHYGLGLGSSIDLDSYFGVFNGIQGHVLQDMVQHRDYACVTSHSADKLFGTNH